MQDAKTFHIFMYKKCVRKRHFCLQSLSLRYSYSLCLVLLFARQTSVGNQLVAERFSDRSYTRLLHYNTGTVLRVMTWGEQRWRSIRVDHSSSIQATKVRCDIVSLLIGVCRNSRRGGATKNKKNSVTSV